MPLGEISTFLLVLVIVFVFGNLWFHFIETLLKWVKKQFLHRKEPPAWHPLPQDKDNTKDI